jgi:hypothetical protein
MRSKNLPVPTWLEKRSTIDVPFEKVWACSATVMRAQRSNPETTDVNCFVAYAPLRKRFAFVAGNAGDNESGTIISRSD